MLPPSMRTPERLSPEEAGQRAARDTLQRMKHTREQTLSVRLHRIVGARAFWAQLTAHRLGKIRTSEQELARLFGAPERPGKNEPCKTARWTLRIDMGAPEPIVAILYDFQQVGAPRPPIERRSFSIAGTEKVALPILKALLTGALSTGAAGAAHSGSCPSSGLQLSDEAWETIALIAEGEDEGMRGALSLLLGDRPALADALVEAQEQGAAPLQGIELTRRLSLRELRPFCKRLVDMRKN